MVSCAGVVFFVNINPSQSVVGSFRPFGFGAKADDMGAVLDCHISEFRPFVRAEFIEIRVAA